MLSMSIVLLGRRNKVFHTVNERQPCVREENENESSQLFLFTMTGISNLLSK